MVDRKSVWQHLHDYPPVLVRLIARTGERRSTRGLTSEEISSVSGLPLKRVLMIERQLNWKRVSVTEAQAFCHGCLFDPTNSRDRAWKGIMYFSLCQKKNREPWSYLKKSPLWATKYQELIRLLRRLKKSA